MLAKESGAKESKSRDSIETGRNANGRDRLPAKLGEAFFAGMGALTKLVHKQNGNEHL